LRTRAAVGPLRRHLKQPRHRPARAQAVAEDTNLFDPSYDPRLPCTVITGYLGSGKTTLLNNLLKNSEGKRIAVIENEFGAIDIDSELITDKQSIEGGDTVIMLNNGCLCCTVRSDLINMLLELCAPPRRNNIDHVVIETTGLANPSPIISTFFVEEMLANLARLDGLVTVVDSKHVMLHLDEEKPDDAVNECLQQVALADRIILNKLDLVDDDEATAIEARLRDINRLATVKRTIRGDVPTSYVMDVGGFEIDDVEEQVMESEHQHGHSHAHDSNDPDSGHEHSHSHSHSHEHSHSHSHEHSHDLDHVHDNTITSVSVSIPGNLNLERVNDWLGTLLEVRGNEIFRTKGILSVTGCDNKFVFQSVHMLFEGDIGKEWADGEERGSKLVFIGKNLDQDELEDGLKACLEE